MKNSTVIIPPIGGTIPIIPPIGGIMKNSTVIIPPIGRTIPIVPPIGGIIPIVPGFRYPEQPKLYCLLFTKYYPPAYIRMDNITP